MTEQDSWRGKVGRMSQEEISAFLAGACLMRLACLKSDGRPYIVPMWHEWDGESFWVVPRQKSSWAQYLAKNKYCCAVIDEDVPPLRKVLVEGEAYLIEEPNVGGKWVAIAERMSVRYLGEHGPDYLEPTLVEPRWLFRIQPQSITTWQGAAWAKRYHLT